jgi:CDGSH-type Zn-finger protein
MVRLIKMSGQASKKHFTESGEKISICVCGLSKKYPYCDGTHKITKDEEEGKIYVYDKERNRKTIEFDEEITET